MRRNFLKSAAAAGIGLAGASALAQQQAAAPAAGAGLRGNASAVYVMNVMGSGVADWSGWVCSSMPSAFTRARSELFCF